MWRRSRKPVFSGCARMRARPGGPAHRTDGLLRSEAGRGPPGMMIQPKGMTAHCRCAGSYARNILLTCSFGARGRIRTDDLPITSRMLDVDLDGSRRIEPAHVGWPVGPDGSRRIQMVRLDDHRDDQGASERESDAKASNSGRAPLAREMALRVPSGATADPCRRSAAPW